MRNTEYEKRQGYAHKMIMTTNAIIRRLQYASLWQAWSSWHDYLRRKDSMGRKLLSVNDVIARMQNAVIAAGFDTWIAFVDSANKRSKQKMNAASLMRRTMLRMLHTQLASGFDVWKMKYFDTVHEKR